MTRNIHQWMIRLSPAKIVGLTSAPSPTSHKDQRKSVVGASRIHATPTCHTCVNDEQLNGPPNLLDRELF